MSITSGITARESAELGALVDVFPVVVTPKGIFFPNSRDPSRARTLGELLLVERQARGQPQPVAADVDAIVDVTGCGPDDLRELADEIADHGVVQRVGGSTADAPAPNTPSSNSSDGLTAQLVMPTPVIFGLGPDGFAEHDYDGGVHVRLSAVELAAAATFTTPNVLDDGFAKHREHAGGLALDAAAFETLLRHLIASQLVRSFDSDDLSFRRGFNQNQEILRREIRGKRMVGRAIEESMAKLDEIETERRARTGTTRTKVFPVHAIPTAWRNPPLSLGLIYAYVKTYKGGALLEHYDLRPDWMIDDAKVDAYSAEPGVYMFSSYIWSSYHNLALSARAKEQNPWNVTIHGGPNVPKYRDDIVRFFADHPHVDITARNEGEVSTAEVLEALAPQIGTGPVDLSVLRDVAGISYRDGDEVVTTADRERLVDLDVIPSPYLEGFYDAYAAGWHKLADMGGTGTDSWAYQLPVVVLETNRGCPYGCTFCDWGSATLSRIRQFSLDRIFAELEWCAKSKVDTVGLADANFGILKRDVEITEKIAELKVNQGYPKQFGTNYAKNSVKHLQQIVETLAEADILSYGLLSLQSMDADTLDTIHRSNIKLEKYEDLAREFQKAQLPLYVDLMVGLPGQTKASFANDMQECIDREVHAKIFPTQLLVNSPMNEPSYREEHGVVAKPGELVTQAASFSADDYERMMRMREAFFVLEKFGILRHVARYVRQEANIREIDLFNELWEAGRTDPQRWPIIDFTLNGISKYMVPPVSWNHLLDEVRTYLLEVVGVADDGALETVLRVQHALLPARRRTFPYTVELPHDYAAWHAAMLAAKYADHFADWSTVVPPLRDYPPATLTVEDPRNVCVYEIGNDADRNPWEAWDLESPVSRPVSLHN